MSVGRAVGGGKGGQGGMEILSFSSNKTSAGDYVLRPEGEDDVEAIGFIKNRRAGSCSQKRLS